MPTPDETITAVPPTPPIETSSSRASFTSCPPEEDREQHAPREPRADSAQLAAPELVSERHVNATQEPTPEPEAQLGASREVAMQEEHEKGEHIEDAGVVAESPSPVGSPVAQSEGDVRLAQSQAPAALGALETGEAAPRYLSYPPLPTERVRIMQQDVGMS